MGRTAMRFRRPCFEISDVAVYGPAGRHEYEFTDLVFDANIEQIKRSNHVRLDVEFRRFIRTLRRRGADAVNHGVEAGGDQFIERTDITESRRYRT
jgi:hypothetical protein